LPASDRDRILLERMFDPEEHLNPEQRAAVEHRGGPLLVVAGAGSGKTWTLACRVANLVDRGIAEPAFTFTAVRFVLSRSPDRRPRARPRLGRDVPRRRSCYRTAALGLWSVLDRPTRPISWT
jgi:DNA helicase-2/ATP-dependent DNA helicase PcrA